MPSAVSARYQDLSDPSLRRGLEQMIRARVPSSEVDDLVQATLADALASSSMPNQSEEVRRWVFGIARHKIVDYYRRSRRERPGSLPEIPVPGAPHGAKDMIKWAEKELADNCQGDETLDWMLREGDGEKLESIASEDQVPAPRVRQRVNRWRKHLRERWAAELAAVAAVAVVVGALWYAWRQRPLNEIVTVGPDNSAVRPADSALLRAAELRSRALQQCDKREWVACLQALDEAARIDPTGDRSDEITRVRQGAAEALQAPDVPAPTPSSAPSGNAPPQKTPNLTPIPTDGPPPAPPMKMGPKANDKPAPNQKKSTSSIESKDSKDQDLTVAPPPTSVPTTNLAPQQQQAPTPELTSEPPMQQKAPKKTKGGTPTYGTKKSGGEDFGSGK